MAICPVQVIMDSERFIAEVITHPGGGSKDFYSGKNNEFAEHKELIASQLESIRAAQLDSQYSEY